jgi:hypothetical protein
MDRDDDGRGEDDGASSLEMRGGRRRVDEAS